MLKSHLWTPEQIALLGTLPDTTVAKMLKIPVIVVQGKRRELNIERRGHVRWSEVAALSQPDFFAYIKQVIENRTGQVYTYQMIADMCFYSLSRVQKWATAGTAQEPLSLAVRHHLWLAARSTVFVKRN